jgi:hypothetical protein
VLHRTNLKGSALVNLAVGGTPRFSDGVREETVKLMKHPSFYSLGAAHIVPVAGLAGTTVRAFMSTMILIGRPASPNKVFSDLDSGARWLVRLLAGGRSPWTAAEIKEAVAAVSAAR